MALSPQEQTWSQLQENLRRKRQQLGLGVHRDSAGKHFNGYKKPQPAPLPRILDSPPEAPLRGTHYPVIPPVANDRYSKDEDILSLQSYDSEIPLFLSDDYTTLSLMSSSPPYPHNGTARGHHPKPQGNRNPWNTSTKVKRDSRYLPSDHKYRQAQRQQDEKGWRLAGRHERGPHGRHVWRDPMEEAQLEQESATVVQRHYRGYRTRKSLEMLQYLEHPTSASVFMHHFLKDLLQHDFILDVVCEVLVEARTGRNMTAHSRASSTHQSVVNTLTIRHSPMPTQRFWREALERPDIHKPVAAKLILEVLQEEYRDLVLDGVNELVEDYFGAKVVGDATNRFITEVVEEMIPDVFDEAEMEVAMETVVKELIDEETQACLGVLLEETFVMGKMPLDSADEELERREVARVAESYLLDATFLDHLVLEVVRNGQSWSLLEHADRFLDDQILEILLGQYIGVLYNRQANEECIPLKRLHEKVVTDVALDVILEELSDQLVEDLEDLNEGE